MAFSSQTTSGILVRRKGALVFDTGAEHYVGDSARIWRTILELYGLIFDQKWEELTEMVFKKE